MSFDRSASRVSFAVLGLLALAVGLASDAVSAPRVRLKCTVLPRQLPSTGGEIQIQVSSGGVPLDAVLATIVRPDRTPLTEELEPTDAVGQFQTSVTLPENEGRATQTYSIRVFARGEAERGHTASGGTVRVKGAAEVDPLIITNCTAAPRQVSPGGGTVRIAARITGARRISVKARASGPGGDLEQTMTLRGGAYQGSIVLPANTGPFPQTYHFSVVATPPAGGDPVEASCGRAVMLSPQSLTGLAATGLSQGQSAIYGFVPTLGGGVSVLFEDDYDANPTFALGDFSGDGRPDYVLSAGPGGAPVVHLVNAANKVRLRSFFAYDRAFLGGVNVAAGDVNGDGYADVITGAGTGSAGGHVKVFDGQTGALLASFLAYDAGFTGGVRVAAGDVNGDGRADIITGAGPGAGPHVKVFNGANMAQLRSFFAFAPAFTGGVQVAAGDVNGDGKADVIVGSGPGATPQVKVFNGRNGASLRSFLAFDSEFQGGVTVSTVDWNGDGRQDIFVGSGPGMEGGLLRVFSSVSGEPIFSTQPFPADFTGGVSVAGGLVIDPFIAPL